MSAVIQLRTPVPGPASRALAARRAAATPRGVAAPSELAVVHAEDAVLTDADGNRLIDFAGGIGTLNVGHRHPDVVAAVRGQLDRLTHTCFAVATYEPYVALAERLNQVTPGSHAKRTLLVNSGAEAVENAVKIARYATGRPAIVCLEHAFHGRTNLALAMTARPMPYKKGMGPFAPEIYRAPFPYCYRCDRGPGPGGCCQADEGHWDRVMANLVDPAQVAAIVFEPEAGEGGFVPAPSEAVAALAAFARAHGILVVADEIQTGFGRTGRFFACDHLGLVPDLLVSAKSLAGGLPLAAVTGRAEVMDAVHPGGLGGTYGGNPLACAAALAVLDVLAREDLPARAGAIGARIRACCEALAARHPALGDVRGLGAMVGVELVADRATKAPDRALAQRVQAEALARGLVLLTCGTFGNVIRFLVPLTAADAVVDEGLSVFADAVAAAA
jgi:4-aminobutyrate aminotransferase / (S)-3-amino-2-methylpropionate transaminase / 5-aminovalerate transaminase